jgi:hypothetical protein
MNDPIGMKTAGCQCDSKVYFVIILVVLLAGFTLLLSIHTVRAQPGNFRFDEIRTINGPCCTDEGTDLVVDDEGSVLISGYRGSLDLDHDGRSISPPSAGLMHSFLKLTWWMARSWSGHADQAAPNWTGRMA